MLVVPLLVLVADPPAGSADGGTPPGAQPVATGTQSLRPATFSEAIPIPASLPAAVPTTTEAPTSQDEPMPVTAARRVTSTTTEAPAATVVRRATTTTEAPESVPEPVHAAGEPVSSASSGSATTGLATWFHAPDGTCAHTTLAMGTMITVTRVSTGASVTCRVADRGPFATGVVIDLSMDTFAQIASPEEGMVQVELSW